MNLASPALLGSEYAASGCLSPALLPVSWFFDPFTVPPFEPGRHEFLPLRVFLSRPLGLGDAGLLNGIALDSYTHVKHHILPRRCVIIFSVKDEKKIKGWKDDSVIKSSCSSKGQSSIPAPGRSNAS